MTGGYTRSMPALGFDPTPGSVDLTSAMARRYGDAAGELDSVLGMLEGLDLDSWRGDAADAARTRLAVIVSALQETMTTTKNLQSATSDWARKLATFQSEAAALERQAESVIAEQDALTTRQKGTITQNGTRNPMIDQELDQASLDLSSIQSQARQLHEIYLATATGIADPITIDDLWHGTEPIRKVIEVALAPFDIVAADHWLDVLKEIGGQPEELLEDADEAIATATKLIGNGASWSERVDALVEAGNALERGGTAVDAWTAFAPGWVKASANSLQGIDGLDNVLGVLGITADVGTMISPANSGTLGDVDRGVAFVNGGLLAANMALDGLPVVGEVTLAATGIYLAGDFLYQHWTPFRDVAKDVGHAAVRVADDVGHWVGSLF
jgi:hypothetical protein